MKNFLIALFFLSFSFTARAQFIYDQWSLTPASTSDYEFPIYRFGSMNITHHGKRQFTDLEHQGFLFYHDGGGKHWEWGEFPNYGLSVASFKGANFSVSNTDNWNNRSLVLSGYGGLGFRTLGGAMIMHQNGIISMGLSANWRDQALIRRLSEKSADEIFDGKQYLLHVRYGILTEKIKVSLVENWPDYVFKPNYRLMPLPEVARHIAEKGHLPNIPAAAEIEKQGMELGDMAKRQQEKIEELFLHLIALEKRVKALEAENVELRSQSTVPLTPR
ncbi:MAG: hypothetical protein RL757_916 [Bacteroidota bacterium]|jgi:hypothetical protein